MGTRVAKSALLLESILAKRTKQELLEICRALKITGVSSLRKAKLIGTMTQLIPEIAAVKMQCWDEVIYDFVQQLATFDKIHYVSEADPNSVENYLLEEGICFLESDGRGEYLAMPLEIQELFFSLDGPAYRAQVKRNTQAARLSKGLLYYYGCLSFDDLASLVNRFLPEPMELYKIWTILWEIGYYTWDIFSDRGYFCDGRLTDMDYLLSELAARSLEYRPLNFEEVWQAGHPAYLHGHAPQSKDLLQFLQANDLGEFAPYFLDLLFGLVQTELSPPEVVYALLEHLELDGNEDLTELAILVFDFYHQVPHWVLRGHSPEEIMGHVPTDFRQLEAARPRRKTIVYDFATKQPVAPDAPCPCGSGRKFGDCCGSA